jgi:hypothetical protein
VFSLFDRHRLRQLLRSLLLGLVGDRLGGRAEEGIEHSVGAQEEVLNSFVVDPHRGHQQFGGELPEAETTSFSKLRVCHTYGHLKGVVRVNFLRRGGFTPFLANYSTP